SVASRHYLKLQKSPGVCRITRQASHSDEPCCSLDAACNTNKNWETSCAKTPVSRGHVHEPSVRREEVRPHQRAVLRCPAVDQLLSGARLLSRVRRHPHRAAEPGAAGHRVAGAT